MSIMRGKSRRMGLRGRAASMLGMSIKQHDALGYYYTAADGSTSWIPDAPLPTYPSVPSGTSPGGISPTDAALLSTAITTAGKVGTQAIIGTPTVTYNPTTGTYQATGGAALPTGLTSSAVFSSYFPYLLLFGGIFLVISMGRR
jgi:hypothetical protein